MVCAPTYDSFVYYLNSIFTSEAVDELLEKYNIINIDGNYCYFKADRGSNVLWDNGKYNLVSKNDDEIIFEYIANYSFDGNMDYDEWEAKLIDTYPYYEWTEKYTFTMHNTALGWRIEMFNYWL